MSDFYRTQMGHRFYESTMPRIAAALERIATALEKGALLAAPPPAQEAERDSMPQSGGRRT